MIVREIEENGKSISLYLDERVIDAVFSNRNDMKISVTYVYDSSLKSNLFYAFDNFTDTALLHSVLIIIQRILEIRVHTTATCSENTLKHFQTFICNTVVLIECIKSFKGVQ